MRPGSSTVRRMMSEDVTTVRTASTLWVGLGTKIDPSG